ncbi:4-hydroxy-tetrahydrodipicolinate synthase [Myxococcus fulvus]|uniref:4-hydroxy-tetrahydrodipicolinate synthase n=1 Tax=Myxococcus fulvus TaxID=33 RepID=A0A511SV33_MYXFU|nr:dihydrodipicolinate synthase family protein [Myxococcus fulvus]AKF84779.1 dihydrodipicolinate synthetase [Myxococcus fulvus 124B02]GEN05751.1 dihydrodipicolinate synthase family protein [Myxococcus fulvus]SES96346.1 4-hydroxy-tetrahydrodipicolinate synthase [Myxococcus fulvus]
MSLWSGVLPAITTPFNADLSVDHGAVRSHVQWLISQGCTGIIPCGSLGEGATLTSEEKAALMRTCVDAVKAPVIPGIAALSTAEAVRLARAAEEAGCAGLMVLPPYVYSSDWREMKAHMSTVLRATKLPCLLYNNPVAYKTDFTPAQLAELAAEHDNAVAVKESSTDARRVTGIRALLGDRLTLGVGVDDCLVEGVEAGARFWVAGLVNAFPAESVRLLELSLAGKKDAAFALYRWFLPLLRLDTVPKFVQLIKLVQQEMGWGHERVRGPRMELVGAEREECLRVLREALANRPAL